MEDILGLNSFIARVTKEVADAARERILNNNSVGTYTGVDQYNRAVVNINGKNTVVGVPGQIAAIPRGKKVLTDGVGTMSTGDTTPPPEKVVKDGEVFTVTRHYFQVDRQDGVCIALEVSISISDTSGEVIYEGRIVPISYGAFLGASRQITEAYQQMNNPNTWLTLQTLNLEGKQLIGQSNYAKGAIIRAWDSGVVFGRGVNNKLYEWYVDRADGEPPYYKYIKQDGQAPPGVKFDQSRDIVHDLYSSYADFTSTGIYGSPQLIENHAIEKFLDPEPVPDQEPINNDPFSDGVNTWGYGKYELESNLFTQIVPGSPPSEIEANRLIIRYYQNNIYLYTNVYYIADFDYELDFEEDAKALMTGRWDDPATVVVEEGSTAPTGNFTKWASVEAQAFHYSEAEHSQNSYNLSDINTTILLEYRLVGFLGAGAIVATKNSTEYNIIYNEFFEEVFGESLYTINTESLTGQEQVINGVGAVINYNTIQRHDYTTIDFSLQDGFGRAAIGYIPHTYGVERKLKESNKSQYYPGRTRSAIERELNNGLTIETTSHYETEENINGYFSAIKTYICNSDGSISEGLIREDDVLRDGYIVLPTNSWDIYGEQLWTRKAANNCPRLERYNEINAKNDSNYPLFHTPIALDGFSSSCEDLLSNAVFPALWENWRAPRVIASSDKQNEIRSIYETTKYFNHELTGELSSQLESLRWVEWTTLEFEENSFAFFQGDLNPSDINYQSPDENLVPSGNYSYQRFKGGKLVYRYGLYEDMIDNPFFAYTDGDIKFNEPLSGRGPFVLGFTRLEEEIPSWFPSPPLANPPQLPTLIQGGLPFNGGGQFMRLANTAFDLKSVAKATYKDTDVELVVHVNPEDARVSIYLPILLDDTDFKSNSATITFNTVNNVSFSNGIAGLPLPLSIKEILEIPDIVNREDGSALMYEYRVKAIPVERYPEIAIYFDQQTKGPPVLLGSTPLSNVSIAGSGNTP